MKVFADLHHGDLYHSLQLLFEKRLGWELYRPIGTEWATEGYWQIAAPYGNDPGTIRQFLGLDTHKWESGKFLNGDWTENDGIYHIYDPISKDFQKAITLDKFKEMDIDIVISSIPAHDETFARLIREHKPKAKHIAQMGNSYQTTDVANVMCSTAPYPVPLGKNVVFYHQEFDLNIFKFKYPDLSNKITSFVNCLPKPEIFELYKINLPEFEFKSYGESCPDGIVTGLENIANIMSESLFGYLNKPGGDGFGHIIHNWFACGRPLIIAGRDYEDKLAGNLLLDGITCIDTDRHTFNENINLIKEYSKPEKHYEMCEAVSAQFKKVVNFDEEEQRIRKFLDYLI